MNTPLDLVTRLYRQMKTEIDENMSIVTIPSIPIRYSYEKHTCPYELYTAHTSPLFYDLAERLCGTQTNTTSNLAAHDLIRTINDFLDQFPILAHNATPEDPLWYNSTIVEQLAEDEESRIKFVEAYFSNVANNKKSFHHRTSHTTPKRVQQYIPLNRVLIRLPTGKIVDLPEGTFFLLPQDKTDDPVVVLRVIANGKSELEEHYILS